MTATKPPFLGYGIGLRPVHYDFILKRSPQIDWLEVISENFMVAGGRPLWVLDQVRERYPVVMHGVSLSIGSVDPIDKGYLRRLKQLADRVNPPWISDHLCWTGVGGHNLHDLLPLPYTEETIRHVVSRLKQVQDFLERPFVIENVSSYMSFTDSQMTEWEFLTAVVEGAGSGILLDINNIFVSAHNHQFQPIDYLQGVPRERVVQFHLAGHSVQGSLLLDTHDHPVRPEVWSLYEAAVRRFGPVSTLIEWDDKIPPLPTLMRMAGKARRLSERIHGTIQSQGNRETALEADGRA